MTPEELAEACIAKHRLAHIHFFAEAGLWRAFAARTNAQGFQESHADERGKTIADAIKALDRRLTLGPVEGRKPLSLTDQPQS